MNPLGFLVIGLGILIVIVGVKGSQHNLSAALTHKPSTSAKSTGSTPVKPGTKLV
jgi:hypothetical protein